VGSPSLRLRAIERQVCVLEKPMGLVAVTGRQRDPDARPTTI